MQSGRPQKAAVASSSLAAPTAKDGRQSTCKLCKRGLDSQLYRADPQKYAGARQATRVRIRSLIAEYLQEHACVDCGESDVVVLEFDHVGDDKAFDISAMIGWAGWPRILREIAKCEVVCANDHRRRTARRGGHYRWSLGELADPPGSEPGVF